jgi:hypothetical protein
MGRYNGAGNEGNLKRYEIDRERLKFETDRGQHRSAVLFEGGERIGLVGEPVGEIGVSGKALYIGQIDEHALISPAEPSAQE